MNSNSHKTENKKNVYWESYGNDYVRILKTGQIINIKKFINDKRFKDRIERDAFLENL